MISQISNLRGLKEGRNCQIILQPPFLIDREIPETNFTFKKNVLNFQISPIGGLPF